MHHDDELELHAPRTHDTDALLSREARRFLATLVDVHGPSVARLLEARRARQHLVDLGAPLTLRDDTTEIREGAWAIASTPPTLARRHVELTGPADARRLVRGLNSGADVFMADLEDSLTPRWDLIVAGHLALRDASRGDLRATSREGVPLTVGTRPARLMARPRGLHLSEAHAQRRGTAVPAMLFDLGLLAFHGAHAMQSRGESVAYYIPKLESYEEARFVDDVLGFLEGALALAPNSLRVTVLIETLPAAFEMDEVLFALRGRALGLNCGRWDYLFSAVKTLSKRTQDPLPDRDSLTMSSAPLEAYARRLITTCHRRGALALGGMAPQIPTRDDPEANRRALDAVREDKLREARLGHDGTWVAHPDLVPVAREAFVSVLGSRDDQRDVTHPGNSTAALLAPFVGVRTDAGLRADVHIAIEYLAAWLSGVGCVPIARRMEDVATAELCRALVWRSIRDGATTSEGARIDRPRVERLAQEAEAALESEGQERFEVGSVRAARELFLRVATDTTRFEPFLTVPAYERMLAVESSPPHASSNPENQEE